MSAIRALLALGITLLLGVSHADEPTLASRAQSFLDYANAQADAEPRKPDREIDAAIGRRFDATLASSYTPDGLNAQDKASLQLLHKAAVRAASASRKPLHLQAESAALDALAGRQWAEPRFYDWLFRNYVDARMFPEARTVQAAHPSSKMEVLPEGLDIPATSAKAPSLWVVDDRERKLVLQPFMPEAVQVIAVIHPTCHFCEQAFKAIDADPVLAQALSQHVTWLAPQAGTLDIELMQQWNRDHPQRRIALAVRNQDWPMVDTWATPAFYFLKDGKVVAKVEGWPAEGRRPQLLAALKMAGLLH